MDVAINMTALNVLSNWNYLSGILIWINRVRNTAGAGRAGVWRY